MERSLWQVVERLAPLRPRFVSVTYGAGGTTRERTHATVCRIQRETGLAAAAHLTCVAAGRAEIDAIARAYWESGIRHIVALRGDPPVTADGEGGLGGRGYQPHPDGYAYAVDLVTALRGLADFELSVAAYPEVHPEAVSAEADLDNLKRKIDAGATRAITQFFFDTGAYLRFIDRTAAAGISVPIVPGILPIAQFEKAVEIAGRCGAGVPAALRDAFAGAGSDPAAQQEVALIFALRQCETLRTAGVSQFHFYTLNRAELVIRLCGALGVG